MHCALRRGGGDRRSLPAACPRPTRLLPVCLAGNRPATDSLIPAPLPPATWRLLPARRRGRHVNQTPVQGYPFGYFHIAIVEVHTPHLISWHLRATRLHPRNPKRAPQLGDARAQMAIGAKAPPLFAQIPREITHGRRACSQAGGQFAAILGAFGRHSRGVIRPRGQQHQQGERQREKRWHVPMMRVGVSRRGGPGVKPWS